MRVGKNKIKKFNSYDILDYEDLEQYLSHMSQEGWLISHISNTFITFEKKDSRVLKFFVDITDKELQADNYLNIKEYKESLEEKNLEYICGNDKFQIFINNGSTIKVDKSKLKFRRIFREEFGIVVSIIIAMIPFIYSNSMFYQSIKFYASSNLLILWSIIGFVLLGSNIIDMLLKLIKYKKIMKFENVNFNEDRVYKNKKYLRKYIMINFMAFLVISLITIMSSEFGEADIVSKEELPLKLEDFGGDISSIRECDKFTNSSYLASYSVYHDYNYDEKSSDAYDEETNSYYKEYETENNRYLSYSVFESKYNKIMEKALKSYLNEYGLEYVKSESKEEAEKWGANEVYSCDYLYEKIVVYDNVILRVGNGEELDENDIKVVKTKLL